MSANTAPDLMIKQFHKIYALVVVDGPEKLHLFYGESVDNGHSCYKGRRQTAYKMALFGK